MSTIADKLTALAAVKEAQRVALSLGTGVPFSEYVDNFPSGGSDNWGTDTPPADAKFFDFMRDRYSAGGVKKSLAEVGTFSRLSAATDFPAGELLTFGNNEPRIGDQGLLIEPAATNILLSTPSFILNGVTITTQDDFLHITEDATSGYHYMHWQSFHVNGMYTASGVIKKAPLTVRFGCGPGVARPMTADLGGVTDFQALPSGYNYKGTLRDSGGYVRWSSRNDIAYSSNGISPVYMMMSGTQEQYLGTGRTLVVGYTQVEAGRGTSYIPVSSTPVTRAQDVLRVTIPAGKTITHDSDLGVVMTMDDNDAVFTATRAAYIRKIWVN